MNQAALELLQQLRHGELVSGAELARGQGCSRTAIWKRVAALRDAGLELEAVAGRGYRLARPLELLDAGEILMQLDPGVAAQLVRLTCLPECDSTSAWIGRQPEPRPLVCLSEYQTAGRGRRGKQWLAPPCGSLLLSLGWRFDNGLADFALLGIQTGLALRSALASAAGIRTGLKWPNDLVARGGKLAGILIDLQGSVEGPVEAVIGVGINVDRIPERLHLAAGQSAVDDAPEPVDCRSLGADVSRNALAATVINALGRLYLAVQQHKADSADAVVAAWRRYDVLCGREVLIDVGGGLLRGVARGIDAGGALMVRINGRDCRFNSSAVSVRAAGGLAAGDGAA